MDCGGDGLECDDTEGACRCPAAGPVFAVDPDHSGDGGLVPTGAETNPACGFETLGAALAAAGAWAGVSGAAVVRAVSAPAGGVFGPAAGDPIPIDVPPGVTLESATPSAPDGWVVEVTSAVDGATDPAVVRLGAGAVLRGFTIRNEVESPGALPEGAAVRCDGTAGTLSHVSIETNDLAWGVRLTGTCAATLDTVRVDGPRKAALSVETIAGVASDVVGGEFTGRASAPGLAGEPGHGVWVQSGTLAVRSPDGVSFSPLDGSFAGGEPVLLAGSTGSGLRADKDGAGTQIALTVDRAHVTGNEGAGIYLANLPATASLTLTASHVHANGSTPFYTGRAVGGLLVHSPSGLEALEFQANRVWRNAGDQIAIWSSSGSYDLSGGDASDPPGGQATCGNLSSVIGSCGAGDDVYATNVVVEAGLNYWQGDNPRVTNARIVPICGWPDEPPAPICPP